jgi:hypothetical protein
MIRLHLVVEGQTERQFAQLVLADYLAQFDVFIDARSVETSRDKKRNKIYRGGMLDYEHLKGDLVRWIKQDNYPECRFTTMVDLYRIPDNWPQYQAAMNIRDPYLRVQKLEDALGQDLGYRHFVPYVQLHEFETLLFSEPERFEIEFIDRQASIEALKTIKNQTKFGGNPELINDDPLSAPSKQIIANIPEYDSKKSAAGPKIARAIGIARLLKDCKHFREWVKKLASLNAV